MSLRLKWLPKPLRQALKRTVIEPIRQSGRASNLRICVNELRLRGIDTYRLAELRKAWGNEGFSADMGYIEEAARLASTCDGPILECGTGVTTLVCAIIAEKRGIDIWCLEQDQDWLKEVKKTLKDNGLRVELHHTPLKQSGDHAWYDTSALALPKHFGLVICDGPFVSSDWDPKVHASWRVGVLPALQHRGITYSTLLLDDANDPRADQTLGQWKQDFGVTASILKSQIGDCAIVAPATDFRLQATAV